MAKSYLKHPLLANPSKWLTTPRSHDSKLYEYGYYDPASLNNNPFALSLQETGSEKLKSEFPTGNLIRIIVKPPPNLQIVPQIKPILESLRDDQLTNSLRPGFVQTPPTYGHVLKNYQYIQYLNRNKLSYTNLPEELRFKNDRKPLTKINFIPDITDEINKILVNKITDILSKTTDFDSPTTSQCLRLTLGTDETPLLHFENATPIVNLGNFVNFHEIPSLSEKQSICLSYDKFPDLCFYLISLVDYNRK